MTIYQITLRDRETRTVLGYYNGAWTTDRHRAIALPKREVAEGGVIPDRLQARRGGQRPARND